MDKWQGEIDTWLKDSSKPNPYIVERKGMLFSCASESGGDC